MRLDRFVVPLEIEGLPTITTEVAIFGSGIAGLTVAATLTRPASAIVFSKGPFDDGSTRYAQGGIAAAIGEDDTPLLHHDDTVVAAVGLADEISVRTLTEEAPEAIAFLEHMGVRFDRVNGELSRTLEGGHSRERIVHAGGDATGAELSRALFQAVIARGTGIRNDAFLVDILKDEEGVACAAIVLLEGAPTIVRCRHLVIASGGAGQLYASTTSPAPCTGDGMAVALRAGAILSDVEFMQFHPTVLVSTSDPRPLISEALRGEGAIIRDREGRPVMEGVHPLGDLAPRDVVARTMATTMAVEGCTELYLDATSIGAKMPLRFPTIFASLLAMGIDPTLDPIPISPAAHYTIGGITTTIDGETSLPGLYAVGEVASTGIHGANRLASNSLLEGVVFGRRIARHIDQQPTLALRAPAERPLSAVTSDSHSPLAREEIRQMMDMVAGVVRNGTDLAAALSRLEAREMGAVSLSERAIEDANIVQLAQVLTESALSRTSSVGAHFRQDGAVIDDALPQRQLVVRAREGEIVHTMVLLDAPALD